MMHIINYGRNNVSEMMDKEIIGLYPYLMLSCCIYIVYAIELVFGWEVIDVLNM